MNVLLFGSSEFYPSGGWHDLVGKFDTVDEAKSAWAVGWSQFGDGYGDSQFDWGQIVVDGEVVEVRGSSFGEWGERGGEWRAPDPEDWS